MTKSSQRRGTRDSGRYRIIAGSWRGRRFEFPALPGLRPTPDRVRETLFNWLQPVIGGAVCLDLYAGSGALGLEALSRGARHLVAIERQAAALENLRGAAARLDPEARAIEVIGGDALAAIAGLERKFDLVFIDPPYSMPELRERLWLALEARECLVAGARVYFEWPVSQTFELPSARLHWIRRKTAGQVNYAIAEWRLTG